MNLPPKRFNVWKRYFYSIINNQPKLQKIVCKFLETDFKKTENKFKSKSSMAFELASRVCQYFSDMNREVHETFVPELDSKLFTTELEMCIAVLFGLKIKKSQ